ncbi:GIY-YIG nuclease family protein [Candidatus Roizmanbacteria bacterium]|nr:GIY-YIG nuclease family protein [Candidatus Roizmanbacteria bacterium]
MKKIKISPGIILSARRQNLEGTPSTAGVYIFSRQGQILYIGKSVNIKARLKSHFEGAKNDQKEAQIVNNADTIQIIVTDSEFKALLLESRLIQAHQPQYNRRWKDDKSYLYIKITVKDKFPKIYPVRRENDGRSFYFGPFSSQYSVEIILKEIRRIFQFCSQKKLARQPCFYAKIGLCRPCPNRISQLKNGAESASLKRDYRRNIRQAIKVLSGSADLILEQLYRRVQTLAKNEEYEEAIIVRNKIYRFEQLLYQRSFERLSETQFNRSEKSLESLLVILKPYYPALLKLARIECYDVSNLGNQHAAASLVVFAHGLADRAQYRRFKIRNPLLRSDFEMMKEVLERRFRRRRETGWPIPDLVVVDGGKPQLRFVQEAFKNNKITAPFIGIAKHPDRLIIGATLETIRPKHNNLGFNLIRSVRDESHRFAKKYHLFLRQGKLLL